MVKKPTSKSNPATTTTPPSSSSQIPTPSSLTDGLPLPKLFVFDLDYTLWPFWVDTHCTAPFKASQDHTHITDRSKEQFRFYRDVPSILASLHAHPDIKIGVASRTSAPDYAREFLRLLEFDFHAELSSSARKREEEEAASGGDGNGVNTKAVPLERRRAIGAFDQLEIYPGDKKRHMKKLSEGLGVAYEDMLFFDDESRNFNVEVLGVTMWLVEDGTSRVEIDKGVAEWRKRRGLLRS